MSATPSATAGKMIQPRPVPFMGNLPEVVSTFG